MYEMYNRIHRTRLTVKSKIITLIWVITLLLSFQESRSQEKITFPFDPFVILKSWDYNVLLKSMGKGEEIMGTMKNQSFLAGLKYPADLFGRHGNLEFTFNKDSIARFRFKKDHIARVIDANLSDRIIRDTAFRTEYNSNIRKLDQMRRDTMTSIISDILGPPFTMGPTAVSEKNARYSATWVNRGYSCLYKDYLNYSEIVFSLTTIPSWAAGEFEIPAATEIVRKMMLSSRKMTWTASILGLPANAREMTYAEVFLLLEFSTGQRYMAGIPKTASSYHMNHILLEFATGQRCLMNLPKNSISYLPDLYFEDCNGDGIAEAWIQLSYDLQGKQKRYYIYSFQFKEPEIIFNTDELIPSDIVINTDKRVIVTFQDGISREVEIPDDITLPDHPVKLKPRGFGYLKTTTLNSDGSANFAGGLELSLSEGGSSAGILEIAFKNSSGTLEPGQVLYIRDKK